MRIWSNDQSVVQSPTFSIFDQRNIFLWQIYDIGNNEQEQTIVADTNYRTKWWHYYKLKAGEGTVQGIGLGSSADK